MTRSIRLVVAASSPVLSVDDETKMNREKHECSLLEVFSDVGSTPTASTKHKSVRMSHLSGWLLFLCQNVSAVSRCSSQRARHMATNRTLTVYVRHSSGCKYEGDEFTKRCDCHKSHRWTSKEEPRQRRPANKRF